MKIRIDLLALLGPLLLAACSARPHEQQSGFRHPGLLNSEEELLFMRGQVLAGAEPWRGGFERIPDFSDHTPRPVAEYRDGAGHSRDRYDFNMQQLVGDAEAAYGSALRWYVTGEEAHARKSIEIMNAWSSTLRTIDPRDDGPLSTSYGWPAMIFAAEIIRTTHGGWVDADQARFARLLREVVWPGTQRAVDKDNGNNWRSLGLFCRITIAVYVDDERSFSEQTDALRQQITHYVYPDGQTLETPRDLWHSQMGIAPLAAAAEIAWHQGVDLYSHADNRLLRGVEWHIPYLLGDTTGWPAEFSSTEEKYEGYEAPGEPQELWPFYELVHNHYRNRMGLETPNTERLLRSAGRPEGWERTGGWGTATHSRHDLVRP
jgi:hypothetical protein